MPIFRELCWLRSDPPCNQRTRLEFSCGLATSLVDECVFGRNNFLGKIVIVPDRQWADFGEPFALEETT